MGMCAIKYKNVNDMWFQASNSILKYMTVCVICANSMNTCLVTAWHSPTVAPPKQVEHFTSESGHPSLKASLILLFVHFSLGGRLCERVRKSNDVSQRKIQSLAALPYRTEEEQRQCRPCNQGIGGVRHV